MNARPSAPAPVADPTTWTPADGERFLASLELFGMRFGLERMRRLMTALDSPQRRFDAIHVVGTNGKSSTTRMIAAILQRHGLRTGAYLSPHLLDWSERVQVDERDVSPAAFAVALQRAAHAARLVDATLPEGERVTQFEALTAAAYAELAAREVQVGVLEAGLGGRYDATSVIESRVQVLTNVGLEHTRWLGPTHTHIAREKLAVVRDGATLVVGAHLHPDADREARGVAGARRARLVRAPDHPEAPVGAPGAYQRANFALAEAAAGAFLGERPDPHAVAAAARAVRVPGRLQTIDERPLTLLDGAHNTEGMAALAASLGEITRGRRLVAVLSILDDKDAAGMLQAILQHCAAAVLTSNRNPRALSPATLDSLARQLDGPPAEIEPDTRRALARARDLAGGDGVVVAAGSTYLVGDLLADARAAGGGT